MDKPYYITQLRLLTQTIMDILYEANYEQLEKFVEERQVIVDRLAEQLSIQPANAGEQNEIIELLNTDQEILVRMNALRLEAQDWLHKRGQAKAQRSAYEAGYTPDSFLMDKRK
ncbi:flagellar protein FliT [Paenibacillus polysaccharolyticus]|uniref:flagellar protein FliT n=1 Tax=Paenibacillus polysaccharolyticus TaxID=582692 RepID=UPI0030092EEA